MGDGTKTRGYRKRKRAIQEEETRQRITEVLVELHRTVGPANTKVTEVAERSGVSRMTVYNHFPTEADLFRACSTHWFARHPLPDPAAWAAISDQSERLRTGLTELYTWYRGGEDMMDNVLRDAAIVPAVGDILEAQWRPFVDRILDVLASGWSEGENADDRRVALRLLVDFRAWQVLARAGQDDVRAADLACRIVACAAPRGSS